MGATVFYLLILLKYINSKQENSEIEKYLLCLGNFSGDFSESYKMCIPKWSEM